MGVHQPSDVNSAFANAFNARDREALLALYDRAGMVVNPDGSVAAGHDEIAAHVERLLQLDGTMTSTNEFAVANGDIALVGARFTLEFSDGRDTATGRTAEVLVRRGVEWVYWIDHPFASPG
jgi:ketosteroid isomerase-like protein